MRLLSGCEDSAKPTDNEILTSFLNLFKVCYWHVMLLGKKIITK